MCQDPSLDIWCPEQCKNISHSFYSALQLCRRHLRNFSLGLHFCFSFWLLNLVTRCHNCILPFLPFQSFTLSLTDCKLPYNPRLLKKVIQDCNPIGSSRQYRTVTNQHNFRWFWTATLHLFVRAQRVLLWLLCGLTEHWECQLQSNLPQIPHKRQRKAREAGTEAKLCSPSTDKVIAERV